MVSKRQCHPISRSEVVAKIHVLVRTLGVKVATKSIDIEGMHDAMMASQWQCHPNSCDEVIDNSHIFASPTWSCNSVKNKKKLNVSIVRVVNRGYAWWDDGVQTAILSEKSL